MVSDNELISFLGFQYQMLPGYRNYYTKSVLKGRLDILDFNSSKVEIDNFVGILKRSCSYYGIPRCRYYLEYGILAQEPFMLVNKSLRFISSCIRSGGVGNRSYDIICSPEDDSICISVNNKVKRKKYNLNDYYIIPFVSLYSAITVLENLSNYSRRGVAVILKGMTVIRFTKVLDYTISDISLGLINVLKSDGSVYSLNMFDILVVERL